MFPVYAAQTTGESRQATEYRDWVDRELVQRSRCGKVVSDEDLDHLLELRDLICQHKGMEPAAVIRAWYRLRRRLEKNFYLLCYRLRNWIAVHYELHICDPLERVPSRAEPLNLGCKTFQGLITAARREFFEHSEPMIAWNDIRIQVVAKF